MSEAFEAAFVSSVEPLAVEVTEVRGREPWQVFPYPPRHGYPFSVEDADRALADLGYERTADWRLAGEAWGCPWGAPVRQRLLSACCGAPVIAAGHTTRWYKCFRCEEPCDVKAS